MAFAVFGPGSLYLTRTDITGATPINIGFAQEFSLDESGETKELFGQYQYPLAVARGTIKCTGKAKAAMISGQALNMFHGNTFNAGQLIGVLGESHTVPTVSPFTVASAQGTLWNNDLGVLYASTGLPLIKETASGSVTAQGEYYVSAGGTYTFDSLDGGASVNLSYGYTNTTSGGETSTIQNQLIGFAPTFQMDYVTTFNGKPYYIRIFNAIATKLSQSFKLTDFMMPEIDFSVYANTAGQVYEVSYADVG
jgi:hypothetical protein